MRLFSVLILCISFSLSLVGVVCAADTEKNYKLIMSTFDNALAKDYAYLRDSIQTMLMGRLSASENIEVVDKVLSKKDVAILAESRSKSTSVSETDADYLVTGGIYALASGINVQVTMYPFDSEQKVLNFSHLSENPENILAGNEVLIDDILKELFGVSSLGEESGLEAGSVAGFTTIHPEAEYKKGLYSGTIVESELHGIEAKASGVKRTLTISGEIIASTVGDLNGDGDDEIVTLTSSSVDIYQTLDRTITKVDTLKLPTGLRGHELNIADLNSDGKQEIYISATDDLRVSSRVVGWNGKGSFITLAKNVSWYLRPIESSEGVWQLAGQKRGRARTEFIRKGVYWLNIDGNFKISEKEQMPLPKNINLFDFVFAELDGKKGKEIVVLDSSEKLQVISSENELLWVSSSTFGGSKTYLGPSQGLAVDEQSRTNLSVDEDADRELIFVPARILVTDVDNDGLSEIVVNKNKSGMLGFFKRLRSYDGGAVVGLAWNGEELTEAWRTGRYKGYVVDYFFQKTTKTQSIQPVTDSEHTTSGWLYIANMPHSGSFVGMLPGVSDTKITVYELDFYKQKQADNN